MPERSKPITSTPRAPASRTVKGSNATDAEAVQTFLAALEHPLKAEILALRQLILTSDPSIREGIKWNVPSFRAEGRGSDDYFATFHLRGKTGIQLILHTGAKARGTTGRLPVADPQGLLTWLGDERASVLFPGMAEVEARALDFQALLRSWIEAMEGA